jgi:hypothetical protein
MPIDFGDVGESPGSIYFPGIIGFGVGGQVSGPAPDRIGRDDTERVTLRP